jgi:hypothetical protein
MIFIGDALFPGGNDFPVKATGVVCISVRGPMETKPVTEAILACLDDFPHSQAADADSMSAFGFAGHKPK